MEHVVGQEMARWRAAVWNQGVIFALYRSAIKRHHNNNIGMNDITKREDALFEHISKLIDEAHKHVKTTVNTAMVYTYYGVG